MNFVDVAPQTAKEARAPILIKGEKAHQYQIVAPKTHVQDKLVAMFNKTAVL